MKKKTEVRESSEKKDLRLFDSDGLEDMNDAMLNVQVAVRIRGLNQREQDSLQTVCVLKDDLVKGRLTIGHTNSSVAQNLKEFHYDRVFSSADSQQIIFENIGKQMALACLSGYNVCIFAYGQTGAGKTYTMLGNEVDKGLIQKMLNFIFAKLKSRKQEFVIQSQYFEIYMEEIIDLYLPQKNKNIRVIEDFNGVRVENLSSIQIINHNQAVELIQKGQKNRHVGTTRMNAESSRSHSIFSMTINIKDKDPLTGIVKERSSKLHFVDLAGSERQKQTQATGQRFKEAAQINQSLSTLGIVIHSLAEGQSRICYRNSKLTHILKDSLGGNSKTLMIAAVSPSQDSYSETLSTLKFAERAKHIKNNALINEKSIENVENLKKEIVSLKLQLNHAQNNEKLSQNMISSFLSKNNNIPNSPLISGEIQSKKDIQEECIDEEKDKYLKTIEDFQNWLRQFLEESGFLDLVSELRSKMGLNINDMMCVESVRDYNSQSWASLFQVPIENLKEYIKQIMDFNRHCGIITGQYDQDLQNKNYMLNSQIHSIKDDILKKDMQMLQQKSSILNEIQVHSQINLTEKDQAICQLKQLLDQNILENKQHLSCIQQMDEEIQRKEEELNHLKDTISHLSFDISKINKNKQNKDDELKEINDDLFRLQEHSEKQILYLKNEIDSLQMQNLTLQEELETEQQRFISQKDSFERNQDRQQNIQQTLDYKLQLVEDFQQQMSDERKQMNLLYKNFSINQENQESTLPQNLWNFIQNLVSDLTCERDQKNHLIEQIQGFCLNEASFLRMKSEKILIPNVISHTDTFHKDEFLNKIPCRHFLLNYINSQNQQLSTWNILSGQLNDPIKPPDNDMYITPTPDQNVELIPNLKDTQINTSKIKSQSDIKFNSLKSKHSSSPSNITTTASLLNQEKIKEFNLIEKQKIKVIQQVIGENKTLCEILLKIIDESENLKTKITNIQETSKEDSFKFQQNIKNIQKSQEQKQAHLNAQINMLKEENVHLKQIQADNILLLEEFTNQKDKIEDESLFYEYQSKMLEEKLKTAEIQNDKINNQLNEQNLIISLSSQKQLTFNNPLSQIKQALTQSNYEHLNTSNKRHLPLYHDLNAKLLNISSEYKNSSVIQHLEKTENKNTKEANEARHNINCTQNNTINCTQNKVVESNSCSSEFYSAISSFSKLDSLSQKDSLPQNHSNILNQFKPTENSYKNKFQQGQKDSVAKQLDFNFSQPKILCFPQLSFLIDQNEEEETIVDDVQLQKHNDNSSISNMSHLYSKKSEGQMSSLQAYLSRQDDKKVSELENQNKSLKKTLQQIIDNSHSNDEMKEKIQGEYRKQNFESIPFLLGNSIQKGPIITKIESPQLQNQNSSITIQTTINIIDQIEMVSQNKKKLQLPQTINSQNSNNRYSDNEEVTDIVSKKRCSERNKQN